MPRLFTAIEVPGQVAEQLSLLRGGLSGARWIDPENYHLTLRFIGDIDDATAAEIIDALVLRHAPAWRATELAEGTWIPPTNFHQQYLEVMPVGQIFNTITHGVRNMPPYGHMVPPEDRWKIVMYLRALQKSRDASVSDVPAAERGSLK